MAEAGTRVQWRLRRRPQRLVVRPGFIPGLTTDHDTLAFAGHDSEAMLLEGFRVSVRRNVVHTLLFGIARLAFARSVDGARGYSSAAVVYLALWINGLIIENDSSANFAPLNTADQRLDLAAVMLLLRLILGGVSRPRAPARRPGDRFRQPVIGTIGGVRYGDG